MPSLVGVKLTLALLTWRDRHIDLSLRANHKLTAAKYNSRFQLMFSQTVAVPLPRGTKVYELPDVVDQSTPPSTVLTDGAAPMSSALMQYIAEQLNWTAVPAAVQSRFAGCKGVWYAVSEDDMTQSKSVENAWLANAIQVYESRVPGGSEIEGSALWLAFRPSMCKVAINWRRCTSTQVWILSRTFRGCWCNFSAGVCGC